MKMRCLRVLAWVVAAAACTTSDPIETSGPIEIAVAVERSSEQDVGVDVSISGGNFRETIHVSDEPVTVEVPRPGTYLFRSAASSKSRPVPPPDAGGMENRFR